MPENKRRGPPRDWVDDVLLALSMKWRCQVAASLLQGNDMQCFSTQQYIDRWKRDVDKGCSSIMNEECARMHLHSLRMVEQFPDIWVTQKEAGR